MATNTTRFEFDPGFENGWLRLAWYAFIGLLLAGGGYATFLRLTEGMSATNLTSTVPWGAWVAFYIYFVGLSAGAFLVSTLANVFDIGKMHRIDRDALFAAIISMAVALLFVWIDLGRMDRMYFPFIWRQLTSALSWEVHAYVAYIGILVAELYFSMRIDLARLANHLDGMRAKLYGLLALGRLDTGETSQAFDQRWLKRVGIVGIPLAIFMVHGGTGVLFAVSKARPYWNSGLFPVIFIISALLSGTALVMVLYVLRTRLFDGEAVDLDLLEQLAQLLMGFIIIDAALTAVEALIAFSSVHPHEVETWLVVMFGEMSWSFWWFMIGFSWVFPMVMLSKKSWRRTPLVMVVAGLTAVIGIVAVRFNIVIPAQIIPVMEGLPHGSYFPTPVEWGTSIGIMGVGLLLYTIGAESLPLTPLSGGDHE
jgi:molybdopterin-containing oxidoreductase family membrane subunit